ncbi:tail fiber assembly protein [Pantoea agglomerans]|uniref:tail fiber assembly protein n=1 Tax=Enterobacter agglomerans TaxID=549 RepID=UPI003C79DE55
MSNRYAIIVNNVVMNIIAWDGEAEYDVKGAGYGDKAETMALGDESQVAVGYIYNGKEFSAPPLTKEQQATQDASAISGNLSLKSFLMDEANQKISVLQDAVDLEMATDEEDKYLPLWKKYRVLLSRIDANTPKEIEWPKKVE